MSTRTHAVDYYVINGAIWRCDVRSYGRRQIVDLMRPRDFVVSDSHFRNNQQFSTF